jgi:heat shock protein HslJ
MNRSATLRSAYLDLVLAAAVALMASGCQNMPQAGAGTASAPSYVPANAAPPIVTAASDALVGPVWQWQRTQLGNAPPVVPGASERYTLSFQGGGRVNVQADCNRGSGAYEVSGAQMKLGAIALTRMGCPAGSQDAEFLRSLAQAATYRMDGNDLVITLQDGASMRFRPGS